MKAVSTIFVAVLMILIAISLAVLGYIFFYKTFTNTATSEWGGINNSMSRISSGLEIESASGNTIYIRNTGLSDLKNFVVYVNGNPVSFSINPSVVPSKGVAAITINGCMPQSDVDINVVGPDVTAYHKAHNMESCEDVCDFHIKSLTDTFMITQNDSLYCLDKNVNIGGEDAIDFALGVHNTTLDCKGYNIRGNGDIDVNGVYLTDSSTVNNTIKNCNIADFYNGIYLYNGPNNNILTNNTANNNNNNGIYLLSSSNNMISNNNADRNLVAFELDSSSSNTLIDNTATNSHNDAFDLDYGSSNTLIDNIAANNFYHAVSLEGCLNTTIIGGSLSHTSYPDYYLAGASTTNNFTNTDFTSPRAIEFWDTTSWFNYNNETSGNIWLKTNVSAPTEPSSNITRKLVNWNQTLIKWNDTFNNNSGSITARYNITGLLTNTNYSVYNNSVLLSGSPFNSGSSGQISFTIFLPANQEHEIIVQKTTPTSDTTPPTFSNCFSNVTNNTAINTNIPIYLGCQWNDNVQLSMYVNSSKINNSGVWTNGTWQSFSGNNWTNFTYVFPSAIGSNLTVKTYANDSSNNQNVTGTWFWYNTTLLDTTPPLVTIQSPLNQTYNSITSLWQNVTLNEAGSWCGVSIDSSANQTLTNSSGNYNYLKSGLSYGYHTSKFYCNDTSGNMNVTSVSYTTHDATLPTFSNCFSNVTNNTAINTNIPIYLGCQWNDNVQLSMYVNSSKINNSGVWTNGTWQSFSGNNWTNFTYVFPSAIGSNLTVKTYANDSSNNQNVTGTWFWYNTTLPTPSCDFFIYQSNMTNTYSITQSNKIYCLAQNLFIDGKDVIDFSSGVKNTTLDCMGYNMSGNDHNTYMTYGVYLTGSGTTNNTIKNCNITGNLYIGIAFYMGPSNNTIINNKISGNGYGIYIYMGSGNSILNNLLKNNWEYGISLFNTPNNLITNNTITNNTYGMDLEYGSNNTVSIGSINDNVYDYSVAILGANSNFVNTNFTAARKIYFFYTPPAFFNYQNDSASGIWLKTNVSATSSAISRKLITWSPSVMKWNDTFSNASGSIAAYYIASGLLTNTNYNVYNNSVAISGSPFNSGSLGQISFTINLPANKELNITVNT